jgi:hypothetical protein
MTISPSRTNDASPKAEKGHHRSLELATRQDPEARAVSQPGEFSTGTSGDYSAGTHSGVPDDEAERRAWATVNKETGGGKSAYTESR